MAKLKTIRHRLFTTTVLCGAAALAMSSASQAFAQSSAPVPSAGGSAQPAFGVGSQTAPAINAQGQANTTVQEVVVTGSRIPQPNLASASPVTAVSSQELQFEGTTDAIDALNQLPQTNGNLGNTPNPLNSGEGISTVNLYGLGSARTLVLEDGTRLMPGDPTVGGVVDIDQIPTQLIDRVEVVTGGASAVYGSDAVSGVVNFIMKHNFEGVQFDVQGSFDQHGNHNNLLQGLESQAGFAVPTGGVADGQTFTASAIFGVNAPDGKGNIEGYVEYRHQDPVSEGSRDFAGCLLAANGNAPSCSGSENSNLLYDTYSGNEYSVSGHSFVPFGTGGVTPPALFNSSPYEDLQRQDERYQAGFFAHYQVAPWAEFYNNFSFMDDQTVEAIAPGGIFTSTTGAGAPNGGLLVNCNNPLLSAQQVNAICTSNGLGATDFADLIIGRRNIEGGARETQYKHMSFRDVIGLRGDLGDAWHYDGYAQFGYTNYDELETGYFSQARVANALNVVPTANGPACAVQVSGVDPTCVPYNLFSTGGVTPAALAYVNDYGEVQGSTQEQIVHFDMTGQLGKYGVQSPFSDRGVGVNIGTEYRREQLTYTPDQTILSGDLAGGSGASGATAGAFDVYEVFVEANAPLVSNRPFVKDLNFDYGYRFSDYSTAGAVDAFKYAVEYAPTSDIRFRGSFQRSVRAPNTVELFTPANVTNTSAYTDPCAAVGAPGNVATATLAQCQHTGVTAAEYGNGVAKGQTVNGVVATNGILECPADQCSYQYGGNTTLKPEKSDTISYGAVITPKFLRGFDASIDYFDIDIRNAISSVPLTTTLNECLTTGAAAYCNLIDRTTNGFLFGANAQTGGFISSTNVNIGYIRTSGIDFEANYRINLEDFGLGHVGRVAFNYDGTYTAHYINEPLPGLGNYDCAGYYGQTCGFVPRFRSKLRTTYTSPWKWTVSAQWRYTGGLRLDQTQSNPLLNAAANGEALDPFDAQRSAVNYLDLTATWTVRDHVTVRAGVNNVFDRDPPLVTQAIVGSGAPNAFSAYDLLGRNIFVGLTAGF